MEDLSHYSSLRQKYTKELSQSVIESNPQSRPQTASKHVSFDFTEQMDLRELRNLREKHNLELERIKTPPCHEDEAPKEKKKKKKDKKRKRREKKYVVEYTMLEKPAIPIELIEIECKSSSSSRSSHIFSREKIESQHFSSKHSLYSEGSFNSKKSLVEEIEGAYKEAKKALEDSFKLDSHRSDVKNISQKSPSLKNDSKNTGEIKKNKNPLDLPLDQFSKQSSVKDFQSENLYLSPRSVVSQKNKTEITYTYPDKSPVISEKNSKIFSKFMSKPLSSAANKQDLPEVEVSIHSDIEEKGLEDSVKSSVDFTISDQTPFESLKLSSDLNMKIGFSQYFENLKKGIFYRLLTPIIQNLGQENESEKASSLGEVAQEFSGRVLPRRYDEVDLEHSLKGSQRLYNTEFHDAFDLRTSRSQPLEKLRLDHSYESHSSVLSNSKSNMLHLADFPAGEISIMQEPEIPQDLYLLQREKAILIAQAIERIDLGLLATNVCFSFFSIKTFSSNLKQKSNNKKLAIANYEFCLLKKVIRSWKDQAYYKKLFYSRRVQNYIQNWKSIKLYHMFQGLKYVCKVHKQWISEVQQHLIANRRIVIFKNWALYIRYRNVKHFLKFKRLKSIISSWQGLVTQRKNNNKLAFVHWYFKMICNSFSSLNSFCLKSREKWVKNIKAQKKYYENLYAKVFLCWKHSKALEKASYIPLRISTKTVLVRKNGSFQEKSLLDIKIIKS